MSSESQLHIPAFVRDRENALETISLALSSASTSNATLDKRKRTQVELELQRIIDVRVPRRRTVSFMPYKMPRALKEQRRVKKSRGKEVPFSLRCRKHKRRAGYLSVHHNKATSTSKWLHTHLWHRKRMKMEKTWGALWMASYNRNRGMARKLASAPQKYCILHDSTYLQPLQISGNVEDVELLLKHFLEPSLELDCLHSECNREEELLLFEKDSFPTQCIGPTTLTRMASTTFWLWLHPSIAAQTSEALSGVEGATTVTWLANPPCRFTLRGAGIQQLILKYMKGARDGAFLADLLNRSERAVSKIWPLHHCAGLEALKFDSPEEEITTSTQSSQQKSQLQWESAVTGAGAMISIATSSSSTSNEEASYPVVLVRKDDSKSRCCCRNVHLVKKVQRLAGFDLILPPRPASLLWHALSRRGADVYPVGTEEMAFLHLCTGIPSFPQDYPETPAGAALWASKVAHAEAINAKRPPRWRKAASVASSYAAQAGIGNLREGFVVVRQEEYLDAFEREDDEEEEEEEALERPTCVPAIVKPSSRGVPAEGATLFVPSQADLALFLSHEQDKAKLNVNTGQRVGQWPGVDIRGETAVGTRVRDVAGCITSGVNKVGKGRKGSRGKRLFVPGNLAIGLLQAPKLLAIHRESRVAGIKNKSMVLFGNPGSLVLRPAFVYLVGTATD